MDLNFHGSNEVLPIADAVFDTEVRSALVHQVVTAYLAAGRAGTKAQKTRAQVSGGNTKPWRQKGTGRARAGTTRGPLWRTGGRAFAAVPRSYAQKVNRKMYRGALRSILSMLVDEERVILVKDFVLESPKTRMLVKKIEPYALENALIITEQLEDNLVLAARNLGNVEVLAEHEINPVSLLNFGHLLITEGAIKKLEERLA